MARITVEDCIDKVPNRFELVLLAAHRARVIPKGAEITIERDNDKNTIVALREIAEGTLSADDLKEHLIHSMQKHVEVDEPETDHLPLIGDSNLLEEQIRNNNFGSNLEKISEEDLLRGIEELVPPDQRGDT